MHGTIGLVCTRLCINRPGAITCERKTLVDPHAHISAVHIVAFLAASVAILGTAHLIAIGSDSRASRAFLALGF